jgi:biofilm PGA synthesis lipoprotein PgaB
MKSDMKLQAKHDWQLFFRGMSRTWVMFFCQLALLFFCTHAMGRSLAPEKPLPFTSNIPDPEQSYRVLCYHDIRDNLRDWGHSWPDPTAVGTHEFIRQMSWLNENGYHPVSMQQILDARKGKAKLPEHAILLTFDDGYKSVYTKAFPVLKQFGFPAVIALVGDWIQSPHGAEVQYGDHLLPRAEFVDWDEVREMQASGLIEVASHSHSLHKGITVNPQGSSIAAAVSRYYWPETHSYENDEQYARRIKADFKNNADLIKRETGKAPRIMVWPYGTYNMVVARWSEEAGMPITMSLDPGPNLLNGSLLQVHRTLLSHDNTLVDFIRLLQEPATYEGVKDPLERVIHVDLDYVYDPDPAQQEANLSTLIDRIYRLHPTTVYLQAYSDPDGDGVADALYFPNRHLPMRADLFSRVAWQLYTRANVKVFAWLPVMAFKLPDTDPAAHRIVEVMPGAPAAASHGRYHRLSIFDPLARQTITEIYEDLGKHALFDGILFHDDATLSDYEDASPAALSYYHEHWNLPASVQEIRANPELRKQWAEKKTTFINDFTISLMKTLREYEPALMSARNLYAEPVLHPEAEEWYAQSLPSFLSIYDFTAVMAMPYMEGAQAPDKWLRALLDKIKAQPEGLRKTVFEMQSRDWRNDTPIPAKTLAAQWQLLHLGGARSWGYYPDDFLKNQPEESAIKAAISVETFPARR